MAHGTCPQVGLPSYSMFKLSFLIASSCVQVGIGGHATIGGLGPISRLWGSALDHIIEAEVVLANGTVVRTNADNHPEILFVCIFPSSVFPPDMKDRP